MAALRLEKTPSSMAANSGGAPAATATPRKGAYIAVVWAVMLAKA